MCVGGGSGVGRGSFRGEGHGRGDSLISNCVCDWGGGGKRAGGRRGGSPRQGSIPVPLEVQSNNKPLPFIVKISQNHNLFQ